MTRYGRGCVFILLALITSVLDVLQTIFWNHGKWADLHAQLAQLLVLVWLLGLVPMYATSLGVGTRSRWTIALWSLWICGVVLVYTLSQGHTSWTWYLQEWLMVSVHGMAFVVMGAALPNEWTIGLTLPTKLPEAAPSMIQMETSARTGDDIPSMSGV